MRLCSTVAITSAAPPPYVPSSLKRPLLTHTTAFPPRTSRKSRKVFDAQDHHLLAAISASFFQRVELYVDSGAGQTPTCLTLFMVNWGSREANRG